MLPEIVLGAITAPLAAQTTVVTSVLRVLIALQAQLAPFCVLQAIIRMQLGNLIVTLVQLAIIVRKGRSVPRYVLLVPTAQ